MFSDGLARRLTWRACVILLVIGGSGWCQDSLSKIPPAFDGVQNAAREVAQAGCQTDRCRAISTIAHVLRIEMSASAATVGVARPIPPHRDLRLRGEIKRFLSTNQVLFGAVCRVATSIVSGYSRPGVHGEIFVPVTLLNMAHEMDQLGADCLPNVVAALPDTPDAAVAISHARLLCAASPGHDTCEEITRR